MPAANVAAGTALVQAMTWRGSQTAPDAPDPLVKVNAAEQLPVASELSPAAVSAAAELRAARALVHRLVGANLGSLRIARQLMLVQDVAERHRRNAEAAIDTAALTRDPEAIERAVSSSAAADLADEEEWDLSREWGSHVQDVHRLVDEAERLLARPSGLRS